MQTSRESDFVFYLGDVGLAVVYDSSSHLYVLTLKLANQLILSVINQAKQIQISSSQM